ncbi:MAG: TolC family protein, partial [Candidatus Aminicenantes bacterium]|nr:TolC family protein [Candidatus Aminicenantes bacterium]
MRKKLIGIFLLLVFCTATGLKAQQNEKTLSLSLEDCILKAMKNNLGVAIDVLDPELADISVALSQEKFLPQLSLSYNRSNTSSASYSWIEAAEESISENMTYLAEVSQQIPSGGSFTMRLSGNKYDTNRQFQTINPRYGSTLRFNFNQPLLKNFGFNISRKEIIVAKNNRDISEINFKKALQDIIFSVEDAYWNLVYSIEILKVRKQSFDLAQDLLEKNKRAVEVGTMAPIEILNAQSEVATREADILDAEATVKNNEDILKTIINLAAEEELELVKIIPKDKPEYEKKELNLDEALLIAMNNRPDLQASRVDLKNKEINLSYTRNQLLPDLSLNASYWSPGVSGNQIVYEDGNVLSG